MGYFLAERGPSRPKGFHFEQLVQEFCSSELLLVHGSVILNIRVKASKCKKDNKLYGDIFPSLLFGEKGMKIDIYFFSYQLICKHLC
jgi:hypothetical protein